MWKKVGKALYRISDVFEVIMAVMVAVAVAVVISIVMVIPEIPELWQSGESTTVLLDFLEKIFNVVIAIEFLKMLCKPTADTIIEVLIFLVARHMIIGGSSALEDLLSVISIGGLFLIQKYLKNGKLLDKKAEEEKEVE